MTSEKDTNTALYFYAQQRFQQMVDGQMHELDRTEDTRVARRIGILECAAVLESIVDMAIADEDTTEETVDLLRAVLDRIVSLLAIENEDS